jgi:hypothetical protein
MAKVAPRPGDLQARHFHRKVRHVYRLILRSTHPPGAVVEVNHAAAEASFNQQIEPRQNVVRQGLLAASHQDGRDKQVVFVHQPSLYRMGGEAGSSHRDVTSCQQFCAPDRFRVEVSLDPRPGTGDHFQRLGVNDLIGRPPDLRKVPRERRPLSRTSGDRRGRCQSVAISR